MKKYKSIESGKWYEVLEYHLTEEQKELLASRKAKDIKEQALLKKLIESESKGEVNEPEITKLNDIYNGVKPQYRNYRLISCDITLDGEVSSGILNYRINEEHKQIRF